MLGERLRCDTCAVATRAACAALSVDERRELAQWGHERELKRGETLFAAGAQNSMYATLVHGALKISSYDADGTEHILSLVHPAGFAGELFAPTLHHEIVALTDSRVCLFPRSQYEQALIRFPQLGAALLRRSSQDLLETRTLVSAVSGRSAAKRVAGFVLAMARAAADVECHPAAVFDLLLTRGEMASLLGLTIETVSRQLTRLEKDGVIRRSGLRGVELLDATRLESLAA